MKQGLYRIESNRPLTADVRELRLAGDTSPITAPGQFVNVRIDGLYLRRPISVCDWDGDGLTLIYKVVGRGTAALARMAWTSSAAWATALTYRSARPARWSSAAAWARPPCTALQRPC